jgi:hypothetical protein
MNSRRRVNSDVRHLALAVPMKFLIKLLAMATLLLFAMVASHFLIYKPLIVPRLPSLHALPLLWWLGAFAPQLIVFLVFGTGLKSLRDLIFFSIVAGSIQQIFGYLLWTWNEPGHLKSFESPVFDWSVGLLAVILMSAVFFSPGFMIARAMKTKLKTRLVR